LRQLFAGAFFIPLPETSLFDPSYRVKSLPIDANVCIIRHHLLKNGGAVAHKT
jgi:hypothetical protein